MQRLKNQLVINSKNGITLIALVVTIIIILILAAITINLMFSEDGIIKQAGEVEEPWRIAVLRDRIENIKMGWMTDDLLDPSTDLDDFWNKLKDDEIINNPKTDVEKIEEGKYEIDTTDGYIVEIIVDDRENITIEDITKEEKTAPRIRKLIATSTTNSITITADIVRLNGGTITYYYKLENDVDFKKHEESKNSSTTITGLLQNKVYHIKVIVENNNGSCEAETNVITGKLASGIIKKTDDTPIWDKEEHTATIKLETTEKIPEGARLQYQINGIEGQWIDYAEKISGLNNGDTVFARIFDGVNGSEESTINIEDKVAPIITVTSSNSTTNSITVAVTTSDNEAGMPASPTYTFYMKKQNEQDSSYTQIQSGASTTVSKTGLTQNTTYTIKVEVTDKAGNTGTVTQDITTKGIEGASDGLITGAITASAPTWSNGTASITLSTNTGLTIQWQKGGITEGNWTTGTSVTGIAHNETVFARLTDGTNYGDEASITIFDSIAPAVTVTSSSSITNSITVEVTASDNEAGMPASPTYTFYIKKQNEQDSSYTQIQSGSSSTATKTGLTQNTTYTIKVEVTDKAGNRGTVTQDITTKPIEGASDGLVTGAITASAPTWSNGTASITLSTTTGLTIQWQKGGITEGNWTTGTSVTGIAHNETVFARLTDGINYGEEASITILDSIAPTVMVTSSSSTTNSVTVAVTASDNEAGMPASPTYTFYIKKQNEQDSSYTQIQSGSSSTANKTGLTQNTTYTIKVEVTDKAGNTGTVTQDITTKPIEGASDGLVTGAITASVSWSNESATVTLSTNTNLTIQWQKGETVEENWTTGTKATGLKHNDIVYARLTDGNNVGQEASITVIDAIRPVSAIIDLTTQSTNTGSTIKATVTHSDNESGVEISNCKWIYNKISSEIGINGNYTGGTFSSKTQTISLQAATSGTYYLHVLTTDKAGNKRETISKPITVKQLVTSITLNNTSATMKTGETVKLTATVSPSNAENKEVSWTSSDSSIATVSTSGEVKRY